MEEGRAALSYRLTVKASAQKEMDRLPGAVLRRVDKAILKLAEDPHARGAIKLSGFPLYRVRIGSYRVLYEIDEEKKVIEIVAVRPRREAYRL
jgi:mRNA interferase RelE/StbE